MTQPSLPLRATAAALAAVIAGLSAPVASATPLAGAVSQAANAGAKPRYVALGDSYASGNGSGGSVTGGACLRNSDAYPEVWASHHRAYSLDFQACSGASIATVIGTQLKAVTARTALITVTVGGDDKGYFDSIIERCIVDNALGANNKCQSLIEHDKQSVQQVLGGPAGRYEHLFSTIGHIERDFAKTALGSRPARLVVLDYPQPFSGSGKCGPWDAATQRYLNGFANTLDTAMRQGLVAARLSIPTTFVDVRPAFSGHGICGHIPWIGGLKYDANGFRDSYHPNERGEQAYARLLTQVAP
jgi:hypothetical protein